MRVGDDVPSEDTQCPQVNKICVALSSAACEGEVVMEVKENWVQQFANET